MTHLFFPAILLLAVTIAVPVHAQQEPVVAAYFYVWYGEGLGNRHWNDKKNLQDCTLSLTI